MNFVTKLNIAVFVVCILFTLAGCDTKAQRLQELRTRETIILQEIEIESRGLQMNYEQRQREIELQYTKAMNAASLLVEKIERNHAEAIAKIERQRDEANNKSNLDLQTKSLQAQRDIRLAELRGSPRYFDLKQDGDKP